MWNLKKPQTNGHNRNRLIENIWTVTVGEVGGDWDKTAKGFRSAHWLVVTG